ncbi:hypothetical protein [Mucilaginibacter sp. KACC 22063]|uniref:hypothetical protein n=1 Tax=Mucilaginibacter sp. KACC 22063 TaxID=3025666 RepID=UPI002366D17F|nr:hypothetical protein [Mucilaginibacter sp. KACC 22063]WDF54925.1 hypothetical protein PQ461_18510 [Mucilaginibacter sp. KACC 22063]
MRFKLGVLLLMMVGLLSCGKGDTSGIPYVAVNFQGQLSDPNLSRLNSIGGSVVVNGYGVAGLVIFHNPSGGFAAYDRCSSYQPEKKCAVNIDPDLSSQAVDPCSGSKFALTDGSPVKGPASKSLRSYYVQVVNNSIIVNN